MARGARSWTPARGLAGQVGRGIYALDLKGEFNRWAAQTGWAERLEKKEGRGATPQTPQTPPRMTKSLGTARDKTMPPFHLAFPVHDLAAARAFYGGLLGCAEGRSSEQWVDFDFFGHQIVAHLAPEECAAAAASDVDGKAVPVRHFGRVLDMPTWRDLAARLTDQVEFIIAPYVRFEGAPGEQATMFFSDPSGNAIELKAFADPDQLFAK